MTPLSFTTEQEAKLLKWWSLSMQKLAATIYGHISDSTKESLSIPTVD